jgi:hypothetical protein
MPTLRITDQDDAGCLAFDLFELLQLIGEPAVGSRWRCSVEALIPKPGVDNLGAALSGDHVYDGAVLLQLAGKTLQIHDGLFEAFRSGETAPWLILEAFDTTWWEVSSQDSSVLESIRNNFESVETRSNGRGGG